MHKSDKSPAKSNSANTSVNTYTKRERRGYLVGMFGQNVIYNIVATGLYFYFQNVICLPAMALGWIFTIARVWDAINDPMMGSIVDRTHSKWGKCRPYLIYFPPVICIVTIAAFLNSNYALADTPGARAGIIAWAAVSYILWGMCYTVCDIPLWGITSLITEDENDRSKLLGLARISAGIAGISVLIVQISQAVGGIFENNGMNHNAAQQRGFIVTATVMTIIATIMFEFAGMSTHERVKQSEKHYTMKENIKTMVKNKPFRQILVSGILRSPIQLLMMVAMTLITYYYANGNIMNIKGKNGLNVGILVNLLIIAGGVFVGMFVAMGVTPVLTKKIEKKRLYNIYSIGGALPFLLIYIFYRMADGNVKSIGWSILVGLCFLFAGAALGGINVLQSVMIADCIDYEEYTNGIRTDGVFFSGQSFITKLSAGISSLLSAAVYAAVGYSGTNIDKLNSALNKGADFMTYDGGSGVGKYAAAMFFMISIPPAVGMVLSAIPTWHYALSDKEHEKVLSSLIAKRKAEKERDLNAQKSEEPKSGEPKAEAPEES